MSWNLLRQTVKFNIVSIGGFALGLALYAIIDLYFWKPFQGAGAALISMTESLSPAIRRGIGMETLPNLDLREQFFAWFLSIEYFTYLPIIIGLYAVFNAGGSIAKEMDHGTLDVLLAQPIGRINLLLSKYAAFLVGIAILAAISSLTFAVGVPMIGEKLSYRAILWSHVEAFLFVAALGAIGLLFSVLLLDGGRAVGATGAVLFLSYILNIFSGVAGWADGTKYLSFFYYWRPVDILTSGEADGSAIAMYSATAVVALLLAAALFHRRDLVK